MAKKAHEKNVQISNYIEIQISPTMRYLFTTVRMAIIKKNLQTINADDGVERKGNHPTVLVGM